MIRIVLFYKMSQLFTIHVSIFFLSALQKHETELQHYLHREATKFSASGSTTVLINHLFYLVLIMLF